MIVLNAIEILNLNNALFELLRLFIYMYVYMYMLGFYLLYTTNLSETYIKYDNLNMVLL